MINRYDFLNGKVKALRNKIYNINTKTNSKVEKLRNKILLLNYKKDTICHSLNYAIKDYNCLLENERTRILEDAEPIASVEAKNE